MKRILFACAVLIPSIFLLLLPSPAQRNQSYDYVTGYAPVADNILAGKGVTDASGNLFTLYAPGYPIILSALFGFSEAVHIDRLEMIAIFNVLVFAITALFLFLIAESIFNKKIAMITALLWITYPFNLWLIKQPNSEVPFICLVFLATWLFFFNIKKRNMTLAFVIGVIYGLSAYVRPIGLLFGVTFALLLLLATGLPNFRRLLFSIMLLAGLALTLLPWEMHVFSSQSKIIPIGSEGPKSIRDGLTFAVDPGEGSKAVAVPKDVMLLMKRADKTNLTTVNEISNFISDELSRDPLAFFKLLGIKAVRSWYGTDWMWHEELILPIQFFYLSMALAGFVFALKNYKEATFCIISLAVIVLCVWGATVCVRSLLRYMMPVMGFVLIFSAVFVNLILSGLSSKGRA